MRDYRFYGWESADAKPINDLYPSIRDPRTLYDALKPLWRKETCSPFMQDDWTEENPTLGQCAITAFLAQDIFGGKVYGICLPGGAVHCFNEVNGIRFDLTSEQFGDKAKDLDYESARIQIREKHFEREEKRRRYEALKTGLAALR